jgi:YVTN family beta-propeller protein
MAVPAEKCPVPNQGHTIDGKLMVGEAEWIWVDAANDAFQARVDTGATTSSISAQEITIFERNGKNWVRFLLSHQDADDKIQIEAPLVRHVRVRQASADDLDRRPVVRLTVRIGDMTEKAEFTLKDRSDMAFPVLLGREFLKDIAVVDVVKRAVQDYILVGKRPWGLRLTKDEKKLYVANGLSDDLSIIDTTSGKVLKSVPVGIVPYGILIDE